jgi:hypothetical protein
MSDARDQAIRSMISRALCQQLDDIGRQVGTPVVYLKAAWADPVLYGGVGRRAGVDVDLLVHPDRFESFAHALEQRGFQRYRHPSRALESYFRDKEWTFLPARPGEPSVDLHCALGDPYWFRLPTEALLVRATTYDGVHGPILSLAPEDQILYAAVHYANHLYAIDGRHLEDVARLIGVRAIDWQEVLARARAARMRLPLLLLLEALRAGHADVPEQLLSPAGLGLSARRALCRRWIVTTPALGRRRASADVMDYLVLRPLLSDRALALPRVIVQFGLPRLRERLAARGIGS